MNNKQYEYLPEIHSGEINDKYCNEVDEIIQNDNEASDQNHELTLIDARRNYQQLGAILLNLKGYCRPPKEHEYPTK